MIYNDIILLIGSLFKVCLLIIQNFYSLKLNIIARLQEIESKLDNLPKKPSKAKESQSVGVTQTPEPRRLSLPGRFTSMPDLAADGGFPVGLEKLRNKCEAEGTVEIESLGPESGLSSNCSTPTLMEIKNLRKV